MHFIQTQLAARLEASRMMIWTDGGTLAASGIGGTSGSGEPTVVVSHERPAEFSMPASKQATELVHLEKFRVDCRARGGGDPFVSARPSAKDPPDFVCSDVTQRALGVECRALADESRRSAYGQLRELERRLESAGKSAFRHLRDTTVYVYFAAEDGRLGAPRPRASNHAYGALVETICGLPVNRVALWQEAGPPAPTAPDIGLRTTAFGDRAHAAPVNDNYRPSRFMRRMGFDLVLGFTSIYELSDVRRSLADLVARKDEPSNDVLLLTAGGPNPQGLTFPGEEFVAGLLFEHGAALNAPRHLGRMILHRWGSGDAWELFPQEREIATRARPSLPDGLTYAMPAVPAELAPGRNDPCPCGSGNTFKRCHGVVTPWEQLPSGLLVP